MSLSFWACALPLDSPSQLLHLAGVSVTVTTSGRPFLAPFAVSLPSPPCSFPCYQNMSWINIYGGLCLPTLSWTVIDLTPEHHSASDSRASDAGLETNTLEGKWGRASVAIHCSLFLPAFCLVCIVL